MTGRAEAALACGVAGRQWSRRWKKRGDGSAYSMLNSMSKAEELMKEVHAAEQGQRASAAELDALIPKKAEIRMLCAEEIRALPGGASDFLSHGSVMPAVCYLFKGCPWDDGCGRLSREMAGGEVHGLVVKDGPINAEELGLALQNAASLRVLVFDGANLTRRAAEHIARAVAGKRELRLLYMSRVGISQGSVANIARSFTQPTVEDLFNGEGWQLGRTDNGGNAAGIASDLSHEPVSLPGQSKSRYLGDLNENTHYCRGEDTWPATPSHHSLYSPMRGLKGLGGCGGRGRADDKMGSAGAGRARLRTHLILQNCNLDSEAGRWLWELLVGAGLVGDGSW